MNKTTRRVLGGLAFAAGALGTGAFLRKRKTMGSKQERAYDHSHSVWARPGMAVTFRAELMPGRDREQRTAHIKELLPSGRVLLREVAGEHAQNEFEK